jgi:putative ABC transport system permease protein
MLFLARKNLTQEKTRLVITVGGVAFSVLLMTLLQALNVGYSNVIGQYFEKVPTDLWVARANTGNIMDPSFLPLTLGKQLEGIDGVADAKPFGMQALSATVKGKDIAAYVIAYNPANGVGKPTQIGEGKATPGKGEIIIDRITAKSNNIKIGDDIPIAGRQFKLVGLSEGTYLLTYSFAFINQADANAIYSVPNTTNYWLVTLKPNASATTVQAAINAQIPGVNAHTKAHFVQININIVKDIVQPVFSALVVLGALIGTAVVGLTIFVATIEKAKEYGVLKAIGFRNRQLYIIVLEQALTAAASGFTVGVILAYALNSVLADVVPQFVTQIRVLDLAWIFAVTVGMAILSSYIPMRRLSKIDPAEVFRA